MSAPTLGHGLTGIGDAGAFLARITRLDPAAVVRLRSAGPAGRTVLWARLPWAVLVGRTVPGDGPGDATVRAADLLAELGRGGHALPVRRDPDWRWPLPGSTGTLVETLTGADVRRVAAAAAGTLRQVADDGLAGRAVGQRAVRDALLDHVAVVVDSPAVGRPVEVSQRLVQAVVRMGFLGPADGTGPDRVQIRTVGRWVGLSAPFGVAWSLSANSLAIAPTGDRLNG